MAGGKCWNIGLALVAFKIAQDNLKEVEIVLEEWFIHHGKDLVYTGYRWLQAVLIDMSAGISFSKNGVNENTSMELFNGRFQGRTAVCSTAQRTPGS